MVQVYEWSDDRIKGRTGRGYMYEWKGTSSYVHMYRKYIGGSRGGLELEGQVGEGKDAVGGGVFVMYPIISIPLLTGRGRKKRGQKKMKKIQCDPNCTAEFRENTTTE